MSTAQDEKPDEKQDASGLERVREELVKFIGAQAQHLIDKAGDKLTDVAQRIGDSAQESGAVPDAAGRMLKGENPAKAAAGSSLRGLKDKVTPGGGSSGDEEEGEGGAQSGGEQEAGDTKVTNIVEVIDIGVPLRTCYDHWTQFEKFGVFTKGVSNVSTTDDTTTEWKTKIAFSERSFEATIEEQLPDDRIVWRSEGSKGTTRGAVSFHELTPTLTRIIAVVEYQPSGFFEKTGNLWRAVGRRVRLDLKHFQRYVTLAPDEEIEGWRGEIRDGEVVRTHEEAVGAEGGDKGDGDGDGEEANGRDQGEREGQDDE
ncbi:polyketide cyclase [Streptomyces sp. 3MP-14]|uniref:Polyketide cyclase n=1 Tax=Streptomyces mimosae TaxID=2586635 RepID=A0A5N5ZSS5_9ACTN|nr:MULTISPECIES: SRPBCC family protein [Streptomyces]KAB8159554.1 polyketide cyclase [Streptomyces mimosae]KAB8172832.1 polyketide cyclase [Streptomyces sp. 3MP-14]